MTLNHEYPYLVPMEFSDATARRLSWKKTYFSASGAICYPRLESREDIETFAEAVPCAARLTPFRDEFKSKMFAALGDTTIQDSESYGAFFHYNAFTGKIDTKFELKSQSVKLGSGRVFTESSAAEKDIALSDLEKAELVASLEKFAKQNIAPQLHDSFSVFFPEKFSLWSERAEGLSVRNPDMIPYPSLCPMAIPLVIERDNETFYLVDHYSVDPKQNQTILLIFKEDDESEQDVLFGGFRYDLQTHKIKTLPDMPGKYNATQWLKEFDNTNPFAFSELLPARREFFSKHVSKFIKPSRKGPS